MTPCSSAVVACRTSKGPACGAHRALRPRPEKDGGPLSVQVVAQDLGAAGVAQLRHRLRLDLADPLTRDPVDLPDLVERAGLPVGEPEAQPDDTGLPLGQRLQD